MLRVSIAGESTLLAGARRLVLIALVLGGCGAAAAQQGEPGPDPWEPYRLLEGTWEGEIDGRLGRGMGRRSYEFVFDGLYLVSRHASVRLSQEQSPEGDYHRELAVYSFDRERETVVLREFMEEGHVIRSDCRTEARGFVCVAEEVESGSGIRARLTVEIADRYRFREIYELGWPGQELQH